jgi:DNA-binding transcriptional LysR family regulator
MQPIHWNDLQDFLAIARAGQLARAAALAGVDATTMGRRLRRLEMRLGQTLFEQTREGQVLTESGEVLLAQVEGMEAAAGRIAEGVRPASGLSGTVRISLSEGFGTWIVARQIHRFVAAHPGLTLDLVASSGFLSPSKREADIAVVLSRPRAGPVIASKLSDYELQLYATPAYLAATGTPTQAAELANGHRLIGYIPDLLYAPELRYLDELHPGLAATVRSSSINAQHRLIAAGTGIGVLPCFIGNADPTLVTVLPGRRIRRSFWLVTHKDTHQLARVRACRDWLLETVQRNREILLPVTKR